MVCFSFRTVVISFFIVLLGSLGQVAWAQEEADSLLKALNTADEEERAAIYNRLGRLYFDSNPDSSVLLFDSSAVIYQRIGRPVDALKARVYQVRNYEFYGKDVLAINVYGRYQNEFELLRDSSEYLRLLGSVGSAYGRRGEQKKGLQVLHEAVVISRDQKDTLNEVRLLRKMSSEFFYPGGSPEAIALIDSSIYLLEAKSSPSLSSLADSYSSRGAHYLKREELDLAEADFTVALSYATESNDPVNLAYSRFFMSELLAARGKLREGANLFETVHLMDSLEGAFNLILKKEAHSHALLLRGRSDSSDYWFEDALKAIRAIPDLETENEMYLTRIRLLRSIGDFEKALDMMEQQAKVAEQFAFERQARLVEEFRLENEMDKMAQDNELLKVRNEGMVRDQDNYNRLVFIIAGFVLLIIVVLIFFLVRTARLTLSIKTQNERLAEQNEQLQLLTQDNELLMGIVAHDLKAPLVKVQSLLHLIVEQNELSPTSLPLVDMADRVIDGGQALVQDILVLSEVGRGSTPELTCNALGDLIQGCMDDFVKMAARKKIELRAVPPPEPVEAWIHPPFLHRVMDNLLSNAIKFSQPGSPIEVSWGRAAEGPWCEVRDHGPGITAEEQGKLFQRFARLSNRPTAGESSSGLGLYIVKTLLDSTHARIEVDSEPGKGTAFRIHFPDSSPS